MAQHDYVIANGTGAAVRSDLNNGLSAIVTQNSGATEPATTYAFMRWADTTAGVMKMRNSANNAWITLYQLDGEWTNIAFENGTAAAPSIYFKDSGTDTGFYSPGANQVGISTGGTARLTIDSNGNVDIDSNTLYVDATNNRVGLGTSSPGYRLTVVDNSSGVQGRFESSSTSGTTLGFLNTATNGRNYRIGSNYVTGNGEFAIYDDTAAASRLFINSSGSVGIGTTTVTDKLTLAHSDATGITFKATGTDGATSAKITFEDTAGGTGGVLTFDHNDNSFKIATAGTTERARIDSSGRLLVGTSSTSGNADAQTALIQTIGNSSASFQGGRINIGRAEFSANITSGEQLGGIYFSDAQSGTYGVIECVADGTGGSNDFPGRLVFSTTADGASSPTERMRIRNDGSILIQQTALSSASDGCYFNANTPANFHQLLCHSTATSSLANLYLNRQGSDGTLIDFRQADTTEGSVSVSGTTVSFNGGHLSRWSQLPNEEDPSSILKGTVMSNLDEMCEWGEEDNEQLNKTKVSDVEGDPNVAGVFVATSFSEDGPLDFYLAMTGDMIIRIAEGVTVQRGQLLMSAGDGTAKPQGDGFVQDKTIAKVTSTHVTCTYDDGSYCVPCVLMAC